MRADGPRIGHWLALAGDDVASSVLDFRSASAPARSARFGRG